MTDKKSNNFKKYILWFWAIFTAGILCIVLVFLFAGWGFFGEMPSFEELENPETNLATEVLSADGKTLGKYYEENRTPVRYEDIPPHLIQALIATEDERFYSHSGIDAKGTLRAVAYLGTKGGASTITQQLAKLLFSDVTNKNKFERGVQKIKEWVIAVRLEEQYTKEEIITMYLNKFDFLYQAVGIRSAARIYFSKEPQELTVEESAVLVAMLKNPISHNPLRETFKENALNRRNTVFGQMEKNGFITEKERDSLRQLELVTDYSPEQHDDGIATYFREHVRDFLKKWINDEENFKRDGTKYNIYSDGLKIYTTIDYRMQEYAEIAVDRHLEKLQKEFNRQNKNNKTSPFRSVNKEEIKRIINRGIKNSPRYKEMKKKDFNEEEILASFDKKREMKVFSWEGAIDTLMTPRDSIRYYKSFLNAGMMSMRPQTGAVKAWVGGINYKYFKYEHVKQARRQVGSTFKPFVYATTIDQLHYSPCLQMPNTKYTIPKGRHGVTKDWTPRNAGNEYGGVKTLKRALAESINTITARMIDRTGPENVISLLNKLGIDTRNIDPVAAIALGSADISVYEMVSAYSTFANKGVYVEPFLIERIEDKNGTILYQHTPETRDVLNEESAYVTVNLLEGVTRFGWTSFTNKF